MFSLNDLRFAYKYPFTSIAKSIAKANAFDLRKCPEEVKKRAFVRIKNAFESKPYIQEHIENSRDLMLNEILSFGLAKILVALSKSDSLKRRFAESISNACFSFLEHEKEKKEIIEVLAKELNFSLAFNAGNTCSIPLIDFIDVSYLDKHIFLSNQQLEKGVVFLDLNSAIRLVSKKVYLNVLNSYSSIEEGLPEELVLMATELKNAIEKETKRMQVIIAGNIRVDFFPECLKMLYHRLNAGENLSHAERFALATFLVQIGMPINSIVDLFRNAPNFNEKITRYQVERIKEKKYSTPSCQTLRDMSVSCENCNFKHPVQYYKRQFWLEQKSKMKEKK